MLSKKHNNNAGRNMVSIKKGFTLAEVLITLTLIGVVASMTIPSMQTNLKNQEFHQQAKRAYSDISNLVKLLQVDGINLHDFLEGVADGATESPVQIAIFKKVFAIDKASMEGYVPESSASSIYKTLNGYPADTDFFGGEGQFILSNGWFLNIQNGHRSDGKDLVAFIVDTNGLKKGPNRYGKDVVFFQINANYTVVPGSDNPSTNVHDDMKLCSKTSTSNKNGIGCTYKLLKGDLSYLE